MSQTIHHGRNIKRFREMLGMKQESLASELGQDWNQKKISLLEQKESVDEELLKQVATLLRVPKEAIENFDEESAVQIISNTFNDSSVLNGINYYPTFNPIDKLVETLEENKKLYERLLQAEKEKNETLEKWLAAK
jgi:transcriptional regulator with XRE-family HTH domain